MHLLQLLNVVIRATKIALTSKHKSIHEAVDRGCINLEIVLLINAYTSTKDSL